ncbi:hypothetical protein DRH14_01430 [Candidatus Shapirobacteria bacterium]|nr:MAG: hypothetical protein DRH14_01430 [Candidatus Shapirobacteria bacterium]
MATNLPNYKGTHFRFTDSTVGDVIGVVLPYVYIMAGLSMFVMLIVGGIQLMTAAGDPARTKAGYGKLTAGVIGFFLVFLSYVIVQVVETMFGVKIL